MVDLIIFGDAPSDEANFNLLLKLLPSLRQQGYITIYLESPTNGYVHSSRQFVDRIINSLEEDTQTEQPQGRNLNWMCAKLRLLKEAVKVGISIIAIDVADPVIESASTRTTIMYQNILHDINAHQLNRGIVFARLDHVIDNYKGEYIGSDLLLVTIPSGDKIDLRELKILSQKKVPVLIKQGTDVAMYGRLTDGSWGFTISQDCTFSCLCNQYLPFPTAFDSSIIRLDKASIPREIIKEIISKQGYYENTSCHGLLRLFMEHSADKKTHKMPQIRVQKTIFAYSDSHAPSTLNNFHSINACSEDIIRKISLLDQTATQHLTDWNSIPANIHISPVVSGQHSITLHKYRTIGRIGEEIDNLRKYIIDIGGHIQSISPLSDVKEFGVLEFCLSASLLTEPRRKILKLDHSFCPIENIPVNTIAVLRSKYEKAPYCLILERCINKGTSGWLLTFFNLPQCKQAIEAEIGQANQATAEVTSAALAIQIKS